MRYDELPAMDYDAATTRDPVEFLGRCRRETPLLRLTSDDPEKNVLLVTAPADVLAVASDPDTFSSTNHPQSLRFDSDYTPATGDIYRAHGSSLKNVIVWSDGAYHARVRRLIQGAFAPKRVEAKAAYIREMVDALIDDFPAEGPVDFVRHFTSQLPTQVITREFGLPPADVGLVSAVTDSVSAMMDLASPPGATERAAPTILKLHALLAERLDSPGALLENCMLGDLAAARLADEPALARDELMWLATILLAAGSHTTGAMLGWSLYELALDPELQASLRADPSRIPQAIEEMLRLHEPVPTSYRTVTRDTELGGTQIPAGTWTVIRWDSVNFDEAKWPDTTALDPARPNVGRHSTFGHGKHFCIGSGLARCELRVAVEAMLHRFARIELAQPADAIRRIPSFDVHMLAELPLRLTR